MKYLLPIIIASAFLSCQKSRLDVDVSKIDLDINVQRMEKVFFETDTSLLFTEIADLHAKHPRFIDLYTENIIRIGHVNQETFEAYLNKFVGDSIISQVADSVLMTFADFEDFSAEIVDGFRHYRYYYPNEKIPAVYTMISGFNESIMVADELVGISLDKYLGRDCVFYKYLGIPQFKRDNMYPRKMLSDLFLSWGMTEYPFESDKDNLLENMVYQGKLLYFTEAMLPELSDSVIVGYRQKQLDWCRINEPMMWTYLVEKKLIYNNERLVLKKFIGDAPFTSGFSQDSPGRTGSWLGWQIVRAFMEENQEITLDSLMRINNAQHILIGSSYHP